MSESSTTQIRALAALLQATVRALALLPGEECAPLLAGLEELKRRCGPEVGEDHLGAPEALTQVYRLAGKVLEGLRRYPCHPELDSIRAELEESRAALRASVGSGGAARATGERGK